MKKEIKLDCPYPKITRSENNPFYVSLLQNLYANDISELQAILQYTYQANEYSKSNSDIARTIMQIALVEMDHLAELANAITCFGGNPQFKNSKGVYYNAKSACYCTEPTGILLQDLQDEKRAVKAYGDAASMIQDHTLKSLLIHIQTEERLHQRAFEELLLGE